MAVLNELEKKILHKINYANKYLEIKNRYIKNEMDVRIFKKDEIKDIFSELSLKYKNKGNRYEVTKKYGEYKFVFHYIIRRNYVDIYIYIYIKDEIMRDRVSNMGSFLNYIPYDKEFAYRLNNLSLGYNSLNDLKNFTQDMYNLYEEFVNEYIKEIEAGKLKEQNMSESN